jgi:hypothetical protein
MSGTTAPVLTAPIGGTDVGALVADLDDIGSDLMDLLSRGDTFMKDVDAKFTDDALAEGRLWRFVPAVPASPMITGQDGVVVDQGSPGSPAQWVKISEIEYLTIRQRIDLLNTLIGMMTSPQQGGKPSFATAVRKNNRKWATS